MEKYLQPHIKSPWCRELLESGSKKKLGNKEDSLFWHDIWLLEGTIKLSFHRLFRITVFPLASVASMGVWVNSKWEWRIAWKCPFRPRLLLQQAITVKDKKDLWIWLPNNSESFTVKSFYLKLSKKSESLLKDVSLKLWKGLVPFRIEVFSWLVLLEKINTKKKLATHNIIPISDVYCSLCLEKPEDVTHLFLHCPFAQSIWNWCCDLRNISWV